MQRTAPTTSGISCIHIMVNKYQKQCILCGKILTKKELQECYQEMENQQTYIRCSKIPNQIDNLKRLVANPPKVILFLDIDKTFVSASVIQRTNQQYQSNDVQLCQQLYSRCDSLNMYYKRLQSIGNQYVDEIENKFLIINFRPGFFQFLENNYQKIVIVIYTLAKLEYASKIIQIIDPEFKLVYRIIARQDQSTYIKNLNTIFHNDTSLLQQSIIFDDQSFPWKSSQSEIDNGTTFMRSISFYGQNTQQHEIQIQSCNELNQNQSIQDQFFQDMCAFKPSRNYLYKSNFDYSILLWKNPPKFKLFEQQLYKYLSTNNELLKHYKRGNLASCFWEAQTMQLQSLSNIIDMLIARKQQIQNSQAISPYFIPNPPLSGFRFSIWNEKPQYYLVKTISHQIVDVIDYSKKDDIKENEQNQEGAIFHYTVQLITDLGGCVIIEPQMICEYQIVEWEQIKQNSQKFQNQLLRNIWQAYNIRFNELVDKFNENQDFYSANGFIAFIKVFGQSNYQDHELQAFVNEVKPQLQSLLKINYVDQTFLYLCGYMLWKQEEVWWQWHLLRCIFDTQL